MAAVALLRRDGAVLLQLRDDKPGLRHANRWVLPGGHGLAGEPIEETARREFLEETAYELGELTRLTSFRDEPQDYPPLEVTVFWAIYDGVQPISCREGQALEFVPRGDGRPVLPVFVRLWELALDAAGGALA